MAKVLLLRPNFFLLESFPEYPLGLAYLAASLRKANHNPIILDLPILKIKNKDIMRYVRKINPDLIGITALSYYYPQMKELCSYIKNFPIVIGGIHVSFLPELSMRDCNAHYLILFEGEETIVELADYIDNGGNIDQIRGLVYRDGNEILRNERREFIKNLDDLPFPAWDLLNIDLYNPPAIREFNMFFDPNPSLPIITTRGCPFQCTFCASTNFWGPSIRFRTINNLISEIEYNIQKFGIRSLEIWDDNFSISRKRVVEFCYEIIRRNIKISIYLPNGIRIDTIDKKLIKIMKLAGFKGLVIAPESGCQEILSNVNKTFKLDNVHDLSKMLQKEGILTTAYFILGLPGENLDTIRRTIQFASKLHVNGISFFIFTPIPGSKLFKDWSKNLNLEKINWRFDFFEYHNTKENPICDLSFIELKKFQRIGYIKFISKPSNFIRFLKRLNFRNLKIFLFTELRNLFFLLFKKNK